MKRLVGITSTVPVEIIYAGGATPVDLNNIFITSENPKELCEIATLHSYPRNICEWIKGIYGVAIQHPEIKEIIAVTQGDCSNTHALMETLELAGKRIIPFSYPFDRNRKLLLYELESLADYFGITIKEAEESRNYLNSIRKLAWEIDRLTWEENKVRGFENHIYLVSTSDFECEPESFRNKLENFLREASERKPFKKNEIRLGYIGVPPIFPEIYDYLESLGARVVFNEIQRQFSMPFDVPDIVEQYALYTYPYSVFGRIEDIKREIERRRILGLVHYVQSFCFRQIEDLIIRKLISGIPILTIEGSEGTKLDERTKIRLQAFVEMVRRMA
ncbi:MAG: 2-hydroxyacyl-CoA dehydratase family protein [bacterium]